MPWKKYLGPFMVLCLLLFFNSCTLDLEIPEYSLEFDGQIIYDPNTANVVIQYTFIAEEATHPCTYSLSKEDGTPDGIVIVPETTEMLVAGAQQKFERDLSGSEDGEYRFRVVVQIERSPGDYVDLTFLDKTFEFYLDGNAPDAPVITLASDTYVGEQETLFDHPEWTSPVGSPVEVFFTIDGNDPADPDYRQVFSGGGIPIPSSETPIIIRALAIDMAGHYDSFSYSQNMISFMDAQSVNPSSADRAGGSPVGHHFLEIAGYGFIASTEVALYDVDGTEAVVSIIPDILANQLVLAVNLTSGTGGTSPGVDPGMGQLVIINHDSQSSPTDYLDFLIE